jgi:preprotein translocase subunit SecF
MLDEKVINFMRWGRLGLAFSAILVVISIASLAVRGLNFGMDFTGGTLVELQYSKPPELDHVRKQLDEIGYHGAIVVHFGSETDLLIRLRPEKAIKQ